VEGLEAGDEIRAGGRQARVRAVCLDVADVWLFGGLSSALEHERIRLDADDLIGALAPGPGRKAGAAAEVDDKPWPLDAGHDRDHVEQPARWRGAIPVVEVGEPFVEIPGAPDQLLRDRGHGTAIVEPG